MTSGPCNSFLSVDGGGFCTGILVCCLFEWYFKKHLPLYFLVVGDGESED